MLWLTTVVIAGFGRVLPFAPIEPFLLGLGLIAPPSMRVPLALAATASHMAGKHCFTWQHRGNAAPFHQAPKAIDRARADFLATEVPYLTIFKSAIAGYRIYAITMAAGIMRSTSASSPSEPLAAISWRVLARTVPITT